MKKITYTLALLSIIFVVACDKADSIIFQDKSTAIAVSKTDWTVTASSFSADEAPNGAPEKLKDNDSQTYWHSDYSTVTPYPHWVLIDMKKEIKIISVGITNRYAATPSAVGMKKFKLEGSTNGTTFISLGEFSFAISNDLQNFPVSSVNAYRYLKLTALEPQRSGTNHTFLAEIDIFAVK